MKVHIHYRSDHYNTMNDKHDIKDRMIHIGYNVFSLKMICRDIEKYMQDDELVVNVIFEYDLSFFDDGASEDLVEYIKRQYIKR